MAFLLNPYILESAGVSIVPKIVTVDWDAYTEPSGNGWSGSIPTGLTSVNDGLPADVTFDDPETIGMVDGDTCDHVRLFISMNHDGDDDYYLSKAEFFVNSLSQGNWGSRDPIAGTDTLYTHNRGIWDDGWSLSDCQTMVARIEMEPAHYESVLVNNMYLKLYCNDAVEVLVPNSASGLNTGAYTNIDNNIFANSAQTSFSDVATIADGGTATINFEASSGIADTQDVQTVNLLLSWFQTDVNGRADIEFYVGGVKQGSTVTVDPPVSYAVGGLSVVNDSGWNSAWTSSELDGAYFTINNHSGTTKLKNITLGAVAMEVLYA